MTKKEKDILIIENWLNDTIFKNNKFLVDYIYKMMTNKK